MTTAQKIAVALAGGLFVVLGVVAAFLVGRGSSSGSPAPAGSASTVGPSSSTGAGGPSSQASPPPPVTATAVAYGGAPVPGGWRTRLAVTFDGPAPKITVSPRTTPGSYRLTFAGKVTLPKKVLRSQFVGAGTYLMSPTWAPAENALDVEVTGRTEDITDTASGGVGNTAYFDVIRPAVRTSHDCLKLGQPAPYTGLYGITTAQGYESAFEGVFTIVVRGGGRQTKKVVHAPGKANSFFRTDIQPPLEDHPVAGTVVAYQLSAKDGSPECVLQIPVWLSPGG